MHSLIIQGWIIGYGFLGRFCAGLGVLGLSLLLMSSVQAATATAVIAKNDPVNFIKTNGFNFRNNSGTGSIVYLRGTNLGNWLTGPCPTLASDWNCLSPMPAGGVSPELIENTLINRFGTVGKNLVLNAAMDNWVSTQDLDNLAKMGMNFIRVPFSYLNFMEIQAASIPLANVVWKKDGTAEDAVRYNNYLGIQRLEWIVSEAGKRGMYCLLDFHYVQNGAGSPDSTPDGFWAVPAYQERNIAIWKMIAAHFKDDARVVGYDLLNEPWGTAVGYYDTVYKAIRPIDPDHVLFMETWSWESFPFLGTGAGQYDWTNVALSLHFYPGGDDTATRNAIQQLAAKCRFIRDTPGTGKCIPVHIGEYYLNGAGAGNAGNGMDTWRMMIQAFGDLNLAWSKWSYKSSVDSGWSTYTLSGDGTATPPSPDVNYSTDSQADLITKWGKWKSPTHAADEVTYLDLSNRRYNGSPIANDDAFTTTGSLFISMQDLLANDRSANPDAQLTICDVAAASAQGGIITPVAGGFVFAPKTGFSGSDTFTYRVLDQTLNAPSAWKGTVTITVSAAVATTTPYAVPDTYATHRDCALTVPAPGVLINDGDPLKRSLTAAVISQPVHGSVAMNANGSFVYTPPVSGSDPFTGAVTFTYRTSTGGINSAATTVTIVLDAQAPTNSGGLTGSYYNGYPGQLLGTRVDPLIDFHWGTGVSAFTGGPNQWYQIHWAGQLYVPITGTYTFTRTEINDDHCSLVIGGTTLITQTPRGVQTATMALTGGQTYAITIDHFHQYNDTNLMLQWSQPLLNGGASSLIPSAYLIPDNRTLTFPLNQGVTQTVVPPTPAQPTVLHNNNPGVAALQAVGTSIAQTPTLTGVAMSNATVKIYNQTTSTQVAAVTAATDGTWTWPASPTLGVGLYQIDVTTTTANGTSAHSPTVLLGIANTAPTIAAVANTSLNTGVATAIPLTVGDAETAAGALNVTAISSDTTLVPSVIMGGSGTNRSLTMTSANGSTGTATVTVTVSDAQGFTTSTSFFLSVCKLPLGWSSADIGSIGIPGVSIGTGTTFTVTASGQDIWDVADSFRFTWETVTGDFTCVTRVDSLVSTDAQAINGWAKAGLMARASADAGAINISALMTPANGATCMYRDAVDAATSTAGTTGGIAIPRWLKLTRVGNLFTAAQSTNGTTWTTIALRTMSTMPSTLLLGMAVSSHNWWGSVQASFSNLSIPPVTPVAPTLNNLNSRTPTLSGNTRPGATVTIKDNGVVLTTVTADANGAWSWTVTPALSVGSHVFTVVASNSSGISSSSPPVTLVLSAPTIPGSLIVTGDGTTAPTLSGHADANVVVSLFDDDLGVLISTISSDDVGRWTWNANGLTVGAHHLSAFATNTPGFSSAHSPSIALTVAAAPAPAPAIAISGGGGGGGSCGFGSGLAAIILFAFTVLQAAQRKR